MRAILVLNFNTGYHRTLPNSADDFGMQLEGEVFEGLRIRENVPNGAASKSIANLPRRMCEDFVLRLNVFKGIDLTPAVALQELGHDLKGAIIVPLAVSRRKNASRHTLENTLGSIGNPVLPLPSLRPAFKVGSSGLDKHERVQHG
ncbi:hypothetical protein HG530_008789 [Fusarium avenaceum]|nr:hypothetical protein HG530_008789 [Fusarium avenaceum]